MRAVVEQKVVTTNLLFPGKRLFARSEMGGWIALGWICQRRIAGADDVHRSEKVVIRDEGVATVLSHVFTNQADHIRQLHINLSMPRGCYAQLGAKCAKKREY